MSALLDDIIEAATDGKQSLSDILRKCLRLGHELKNERLKTWANQELNGYGNIDDLPAYRTVRADAFGSFSGPYGSRASYPIPSVVLDQKHRMWAEQVLLTQAVSAYEGMTTEVKGSSVLSFPWPPNMVIYYQKRFFEGRFALVSAWQETPQNVIVAMLDTVRNRTLNMALEIKDELGTSYTDLQTVKAPEAAKIQHIVFQNTGGHTYVALDQATLNASTHESVIAVGDKKALDSILKKAGLDASDLKELTDAIPADGEKIGTKVKTWIIEKAPKVAVGGVKIGVQIGTELLTKWLMQYCGVN